LESKLKNKTGSPNDNIDNVEDISDPIETDPVVEKLEEKIRKNIEKRKKSSRKIKEKRDEELEIFKKMFYIHILESLAKSDIYGPSHINLSYIEKFSLDNSDNLMDSKDSNKKDTNKKDSNKKTFAFKYNCIYDNETRILRVVFTILQELKKKKLIKNYMVNTMYSRNNKGDILIYK
jgi:hypothetical protein